GGGSRAERGLLPIERGSLLRERRLRGIVCPVRISGVPRGASGHCLPSRCSAQVLRNGTELTENLAASVVRFFR
ncbi:unnamed protein product, partial [Ostreobium quekettii]